MTWVEVIVLAIVQGLTEFIPVSSTAHLTIVPALVGWHDPGAAFTAVLQLGTLAAVVSYYWRDIVRIARAMLTDIRRDKLAVNADARVGWMIVIGTLPIIVIGVLFRNQIKSTLRSLYIVAGSLAGVALLLALAEWYISRRSGGGFAGRDVEQVGPREATVVGCAQAAALVPGTSRSGATILGGLLCGLSREAAARFSFLLSIPSVFAAGVFELIEAREELMKSTLGPMKIVVSVIVAGAVGYVTIPWLLGYLRRHTMFLFIVYRLLIAGVLLYLLHSGRLAASS